MAWYDIKHFNWLQTPTAWEQSEAWRARRQAMTQDFLDNSDLINSSFADAANNLGAGIAKLAATAALHRINAAAKAKFDQAAAVKLDKVAPGTTATAATTVDTTA
jgi:hypothetical protein